jgi:molecular chaperone GrpE
LIPPPVAEDDPFVQGVSLVRQQFLTTLEGLGVRRNDSLGRPFDPTQQEAVATMPPPPIPRRHVVGIVRPGYVIGDEVLRPAQVAVTATRERLGSRFRVRGKRGFPFRKGETGVSLARK